MTDHLTIDSIAQVLKYAEAKDPLTNIYKQLHATMKSEENLKYLVRHILATTSWECMSAQTREKLTKAVNASEY